MCKLQYFDGKEWLTISEWESPTMAWISLGGDNYNYRVIAPNGEVVHG